MKKKLNGADVYTGVASFSQSESRESPPPSEMHSS